VVRRFVLLQPFINGRAQRVLAGERRRYQLPLTSQEAAPHTTPFAMPSAPPFTNILYGAMAPSHMASDTGALKDWTVKSLLVPLHSVGLSTHGSKVELFTRYKTYSMQQIEEDDGPPANATTSLKADGTDKCDGQGGAAGTSASGVADGVVAGPTVGDPAAAGADGGCVDGEARVTASLGRSSPRS